MPAKKPGVRMRPTKTVSKSGPKPAARAATRAATKRAPQVARRAATKAAEPARIEIRNVNVPGRRVNVDAAKYAAMRAALLKVLPHKPPGLTQAEMFAAVRQHLPAKHFPGGAKANWWAKTVQLDLEARRLLHRLPVTPVRWHRRRNN